MASKKRTRTRSGSPPRHRGLGFLFWLCLAAIAVAVAVAAREPLRAAVQELGGGKPSACEARAEGPAEGHRRSPVGRRAAAEERAAGIAGLACRRDHACRAAPTPPAAIAAPSAKGQPAQQPEKPAVRKARLYFTTIDQSGRIQLKSVIRPIAASDSPLRDTLESLLKGPTSQELNLGYVSMIPVDARLRGVTVKGDTAVVDFSESFRFNPQGLEAMDAQLRQVVFAATEFPSVKNVQIQIEGRTVRYLGTEGMRLDAPLSRASFQN